MTSVAGTRSWMEADHWILIAWVTGVVHAGASALLLATTGRNVALAAHYPLASALAVLILALGVRRGSRVAALVLFVGAMAPPLVKLTLGAIHPVDLAGFVLGPLYGLGLAGTVRARRVAGAVGDSTSALSGRR